MTAAKIGAIIDRPGPRLWCEDERRLALEKLLADRIGPLYEERRSQAEELLETLSDPATDEGELAALIEADDELAAYIHERENRPFFGAVTAHPDLAELIVILGREKIARLVLAHALRRAFRPDDIESHRLTRTLWREGRLAAEHAVRVGVEAAQRQDGGVIDVRALDVIYGRCLFAPLGAVAAVFLAGLETPITDEAEVIDLGPGALAAMILLSWGGSVHLAADLADLDHPDEARDRTVDLMTVGLALARCKTQGDAMPPSPATLERLGFDPADWPDFLTSL